MRNIDIKDNEDMKGYDIPYIQRYLIKYEWTRYVPISPTFRLPRNKFHNKKEDTIQSDENLEIV